MKKIPKTAKGKRRIYEVCTAIWIDLLGYGSMLEKAGFDPSHKDAQSAIKRLTDFHLLTSKHAHRYFPILALNDGVVTFRDLSPRTKSVTFDFLSRAISLFLEIKKQETENGFPGARMIIANGFRVRIKNEYDLLQHGKVKAIRDRLGKRLITKDEAINEAYKTKPDFGVVPELQANFAFTKAYLADRGGSKEGFAGPNCFIDLTLFEDNVPDWIRFEKTIKWKKMGIRGSFGQLESYDKEKANSTNHSGILDAFDIANKISLQNNITNVLIDSTIKKR